MAVERRPTQGERRRNFRRTYDPMIRSKRELEPVRIVVELRQAEFQALSAASGRVPPSDFLRLVALRLAALGEAKPAL
jgi:hypothetical protein